MLEIHADGCGSIGFGRCGYETAGKLAQFLAVGRRREAVSAVLRSTRMRISWVVKIHGSIDFDRCGYETAGKLTEFLAQGRHREAVTVVLVTGGAKMNGNA
ncbi:hypothetical protein QYF36_018069 [Acer negundo]|nr:hypothetical protein QYF36_018069 [Acer negundo]